MLKELEHYSEVKELLISWVAISVIFALAMTSSLKGLFYLLVISFFTVGVGFIAHELSHKFVAKSFGCKAHYHSSHKMLLFSLIMSVFGIIFVAPGGVIISGNISKEAHGKIALAGPLANIVVAILFLLVPGNAGNFGSTINSWLALFNLLPFLMLDGVKVLAWNKKVYAISLIAAIGLLFIS
jgi:Zn-dependent protease